jgi:hypothetical protein
MRRDYFSIDFRLPPASADGTGPDRPTIEIGFEGPSGTLRRRLSTDDGNGDGGETDGESGRTAARDALGENGIDAGFRLKESPEEDGATGVFAITDRVTGEFVLEVNAPTEEVLSFVDAAREADPAGEDGDGHYRIRIETDAGPVTFDKRTLLVYDHDGSLLRQHSLIPSGVEL